MTIEYLDVRTEPVRHRTRHVVVIALLVALVLGALALLRWTDATRADANAVLAQALADAEDRAAAGEASVLATLAYASPMIWSSSVPEDVRAGLRSLVERRAADVAAELARLEGSASGVTVLPWQGQQARARQDVVDAIHALGQRFDLIARDARQIGPVMAVAAPSSEGAWQTLRASGADDALVR